MGAHSDSVTQVKVLKAGDLFNQLGALIQTLYLKTHAYVMASISSVAQKQMASTSSTVQKQKQVAGEANFPLKMSCKESYGSHRTGWTKLLLLLPVLHLSQQKRVVYWASSLCRVVVSDRLLPVLCPVVVWGSGRKVMRLLCLGF